MIQNNMNLPCRRIVHSTGGMELKQKVTTSLRG